MKYKHCLTALEPDDLGSNPDRKKLYFSSSKCQGPFWGSAICVFCGGGGYLSGGHHSLPLSAEVRNKWRLTSTPFCLHDVHMVGVIAINTHSWRRASVLQPRQQLALRNKRLILNCATATEWGKPAHQPRGLTPIRPNESRICWKKLYWNGEHGRSNFAASIFTSTETLLYIFYRSFQRQTPAVLLPPRCTVTPRTQQLSACAATCTPSVQNHYLCSRSVCGTKFINPKDVGRIKYLVSSHWKTEKQFVSFGSQTGYRTPQVTRRPCTALSVFKWRRSSKRVSVHCAQGTVQCVLCTVQCQMLVQYTCIQVAVYCGMWPRTFGQFPTPKMD